MLLYILIANSLSGDIYITPYMYIPPLKQLEINMYNNIINLLKIYFLIG